MSDPILVAIHPEGDSRETLRLAVCAARVFERPLLLAGVSVARDVVPAVPTVGRFLQVLEPGLLEGELRRHVEGLRASIPTDVESEVTVVSSETVEGGIDVLVSRHHAHLVVVGATQRNLLTRTMREDPGLDVVRGVSVPVMIAAAEPRDAITATAPKLVGLAWDDSAASRTALVAAAELAMRAGAALRVFHVTPPLVALTPALLPPFSPTVMLPEDPTDAARLVETRRDRVMEEFRRAADDVGVAVPFELVVREGPVAPTLAAAASMVDLLVVGTGQAGVLRRLATGSVSESLVHHVRRPLLVVPEGAWDADASRDSAAGARA